MIRVIITFIISLICTSAFAQNDSISDYYITYYEKIITGISIQENNDIFSLGYKDQLERYSVELTPNIERKLNLNFTYKILDFSIGFTPNFLKSDRAQNKSQNFNFNFRFKYKQWAQSFLIMNQKGFYLDLDDKANFYYPQFRSIKIGGATSYVFNKNYSYQTLFNPDEWQVKSAGSFIQHFSIYYTNLKSLNKADHFDINIYSITFSPSYYYNWVIHKNFLVGAGINLGIGTNIINRDLEPLFEFSNNIKIGYNTDKFFTSVGFNGTSLLFETKKQSYNNTFDAIKFEVGYRFDPPKKAKKLYDDALEIIPIKI